MTDWHPEDIKAAVRKRGATLTDVARAAGMGSANVRIALRLPRQAAEKAVADFLGVHPQVIWPSRYQRDGSRKRPQPARNYRAEPLFGNPVQ